MWRPGRAAQGFGENSQAHAGKKLNPSGDFRQTDLETRPHQMVSLEGRKGLG